jgi:hypothetical protein
MRSLSLKKSGGREDTWRPSSAGVPCWQQGCQMAYFQTKNPNLGKYCADLEWKMFVYFMEIWYILWQFGTVVVIWCCCGNLVFSPFWYTASRKIWQPCCWQPLRPFVVRSIHR